MVESNDQVAPPPPPTTSSVFEPAPPSAPKPDTPPSTWWRVVRWLPLIVLIATFVLGLVAIVALDGMAKIAAWYGSQVVFVAVSLVVLLGAFGRLLYRRRAPSRLGWATLICGTAALIASAPWLLGRYPIAFPTDRADVKPGVEIRVPMDGPVLVGWGGDSVRTNYHAAVPDQRWAYDLLIEPALVDSDELSDYGCFGAPIVAPIAGEVVWVVDGLIDQVPGEMDGRNATGNTVAIEIADTGTYLVIAHFQQDSVSVAEGDFVEEGQMIGRCGNSGNTSEPHVHIHHQRQLPSLASLGFAEGLPLSFRDNSGPSLPLGGLAERDGKVVATGDEIEHVGP